MHATKTIIATDVALNNIIKTYIKAFKTLSVILKHFTIHGNPFKNTSDFSFFSGKNIANLILELILKIITELRHYEVFMCEHPGRSFHLL